MSDKKIQPKWFVSPEKEGGHYTNVVKIQSSAFDFVVDFGKKVPNREDVVLESRVILSPDHMKAFINLLQNHYSVYEKRKTDSQDPPPGMYFDDFRFQR